MFKTLLIGITLSLTSHNLQATHIEEVGGIEGISLPGPKFFSSAPEELCTTLNSVNELCKVFSVNKTPQLASDITRLNATVIFLLKRHLLEHFPTDVLEMAAYQNSIRMIATNLEQDLQSNESSIRVLRNLGAIGQDPKSHLDYVQLLRDWQQTIYENYDNNEVNSANHFHNHKVLALQNIIRHYWMIMVDGDITCSIQAGQKIIDVISINISSLPEYSPIIHKINQHIQKLNDITERT